MPKQRCSGDGVPLLFIPYNRKPFLENKKKVRGKNRQLFEELEKLIIQFEIALSRNDFDSKDVREETHDFLAYVQGIKNRVQRR
ncbi:MAG: hypothetical protein ACM37W_25705 [Actinomycetota bacterium]